MTADDHAKRSKSPAVRQRKTPSAVPDKAAAGEANDFDPEERQKVYEVVNRFAYASWPRAFFELGTTLAFYVLVWGHRDSWVATCVASLLRVRLFILFHDMAHGSFFPSAAANKWIGVLIGTLNHSPFSFWQRGHNHHHRHSNNLKYPQLSQSSPWTLEFYNAQSKWMQALYRFVFHPFGFLVVAPITLFGLLFRFVSKWYELVLSFSYWGFMWYMGWGSFEFWSYILAGIPAFSLFHAQHTFPKAARFPPERWSFYENAMSGSSFLQVPALFKYFTANIEIHHIHHLNPLVPMYNLPACHKAAGALFDRVPRVYMSECFATMTPMVWDEANEKWHKLM